MGGSHRRDTRDPPSPAAPAPVDVCGSIHKTLRPLLHCLSKSVLGGSNTLQQCLVGLDLLLQGRLLLPGAVQRLGQSIQLQLKIGVGVLGGAKLLDLLGEATLQLTKGVGVLLALKLERGKLFTARLEFGLQLRHLRLQLLLGGLGSCGSVLCFLEGPAKRLLTRSKLLLMVV